MISPLEAALMVAALAAPFYALVCWQLERLSDPAYLRANGVAVAHPGVIQRRGPIIGRYRASEIYPELLSWAWCTASTASSRPAIATSSTERDP